MKQMELEQELRSYGIETTGDIVYQSSYDSLYQAELSVSDEREKATRSSLGALSVDTGIFTGRSPKDKYIVEEPDSKDSIWWENPRRPSSNNHPIKEEVWEKLYTHSCRQLSNKKLYVQDAFVGADPRYRMKIRVVTEVAWQAHFVKNMFIRPTEEELEDFRPDFVMLNACKTSYPDYRQENMNSEVYIAFHLGRKRAIIGGTWYGGEIKKGFFSLMNYFLPLQGLASMHCSANQGKDGSTALFFGLSGTGKTTLSTDPDRALIGDDEHAWGEDGVFNLEGGCYAKCIHLNPEKEADIYHAIRRNALLENVVIDSESGAIDFSDSSKTENTRVSYPIYHIDNIVKPVSRGTHPSRIIFLTADAFGVLPPVACLNEEQCMYHFLSGYTAKVAGTERGVKEPQPTFSACFGAAFLLLHPTVYAHRLIEKIQAHHTRVYLVNTGWIGGGYGQGQRIDIPSTRKIIHAILDGSLDAAPKEILPVFNLEIPVQVNGVDSKILHPGRYWADFDQWKMAANALAKKFIRNFETFTDTEEGRKLVHAGPSPIE